jgi:hypothetical protein
MSRSETETKSASGSVASSTANARLTGSWLVFARVLWLVLVIPSVVLFVASLPVYYQQLQRGCVDPISCSIAGALPVQMLQALPTIGLSASVYAALLTSFSVIIEAIWWGVGFLIFWRRSDDWLALLAAFVLVMLNIILAFLNNPASKGAPFSTNWPVWLYVLVTIVTTGAIIYSQIYRYRRVSTPVQRQQTKWVVLGVTLAVGSYLSLLVISAVIPSLDNNIFFNEVWSIILPVTLLPIPLSFGFSILRFRLYDIDVLINRTLVYGSLTALLALVYLGLIFGLQFLLRGIINQQNDVAIVVSTLTIAALFQPLRHRIQAIIDRRFYRRQNDAAKTLEAFSATLRNEVDLSQLSEQLISIVQGTMQPAHVSL